MVYDECKVYGPYKCKDGRRRVVVEFPGRQRKTVSYPKFLVEKKIGRFLNDNETIDHNDRNVDNDDLSNLIIRDRSQHSSMDCKRIKPKETTCPNCGIITFVGSIVEQNRGKAIGFCSKKCIGKYGSEVRKDRRNKIKTEYSVQYTTLKEVNNQVPNSGLGTNLQN